MNRKTARLALAASFLAAAAALLPAASAQAADGHVHETSASSGSGHSVNVNDLSITKYVDKSSPDLLLSACNGKHYSAVLSVRRAGEQPLEYDLPW